MIVPATLPLLVRPLPIAEGEWFGGGGRVAATWHLSVLDAGHPRGNSGRPVNSAHVLAKAPLLARSSWHNKGLRETPWFVSIGLPNGGEESFQQFLFGVRGAIPDAGDFNGDGRTDLGIYYHVEWFIDINGNGLWDDEDLWAQLGTKDDQPVVGDWNGDGKADIGIFGPEWSGDGRALAREPGLANSYVGGQGWQAALSRLLRFLPVTRREFILKDLRIFFRDTTQWSQLILLAVLLVVYVFNIRALPLFSGEPVPFTLVTLVVFLNQGLNAKLVTGTEYSILAYEGVVPHPIFSENVGDSLRPIGRLKIIALQEKSATAQIVQACDAVEVGMALVPYEEVPVPITPPVDFRRYGVHIDPKNAGYIVDASPDKAAVGAGDIVNVPL